MAVKNVLAIALLVLVGTVVVAPVANAHRTGRVSMPQGGLFPWLPDYLRRMSFARSSEEGLQLQQQAAAAEAAALANQINGEHANQVSSSTPVTEPSPGSSHGSSGSASAGQSGGASGSSKSGSTDGKPTVAAPGSPSMVAAPGSTSLPGAPGSQVPPNAPGSQVPPNAPGSQVPPNAPGSQISPNSSNSSSSTPPSVPPPVEPNCPPTGSECDFYFKGYEGQVPTFTLPTSGGDQVISEPVEAAVKGSVMVVNVLNSQKAEYICGSSMPPDDQFYTNQDVVQVRTIQPNAAGNYSGVYVKLTLTQAQIEVYNQVFNLNMGDGSTSFPEDRRCLIFKTS